MSLSLFKRPRIDDDDDDSYYSSSKSSSSSSSSSSTAGERLVGNIIEGESPVRVVPHKRNITLHPIDAIARIDVARHANYAKLTDSREMIFDTLFTRDEDYGKTVPGSVLVRMADDDYIPTRNTQFRAYTCVNGLPSNRKYLCGGITPTAVDNHGHVTSHQGGRDTTWNSGCRPIPANTKVGFSVHPCLHRDGPNGKLTPFVQHPALPEGTAVPHLFPVNETNMVVIRAIIDKKIKSIRNSKLAIYSDRPGAYGNFVAHHTGAAVLGVASFQESFIEFIKQCNDEKKDILSSITEMYSDKQFHFSDYYDSALWTEATRYLLLISSHTQIMNNPASHLQMKTLLKTDTFANTGSAGTFAELLANLTKSLSVARMETESKKKSMQANTSEIFNEIGLAVDHPINAMADLPRKLQKLLDVLDEYKSSFHDIVGMELRGCIIGTALNTSLPGDPLVINMNSK